MRGGRRRARGLFVTGTDTGVGKTLVASAIARVLADRGLAVGAMKPAETGIRRAPGPDVRQLAAAARDRGDLALRAPYAFRAPLAPWIAAALEGARIAPRRILGCFRAIARERDLVVVEGAGGLRVPYARGLDAGGIARLLGLPVLIVARDALGTINHTVLTVEAARRQGLRIAGIVLNRIRSRSDPSIDSNAHALAEMTRARLLGTLPYLARRDPAALARAARRHLDLARLFGTMGLDV
ncbi:MAG: dethiobiotin synthase [Planctomycetes bacterium]|nr:dethiobiotin synthase [Planctomycetota bacterium]